MQKLTKEELHEELKVFKPTTHALLANADDDDTGELQFRTRQPLKHSNCCYDYLFSFQESLCTIS